MASRSSALRKSSAKSKSAAKPASKTKLASKTKTPAKTAAPKIGKLPEWNLADLYPAIDAPEVARDLDRLDADCAAFETAYKGKIAEEVAKPNGGAWLAEAVKSYEAIDDLAQTGAGLGSALRHRGRCARSGRHDRARGTHRFP